MRILVVLLDLGLSRRFHEGSRMFRWCLLFVFWESARVVGVAGGYPAERDYEKWKCERVRESENQRR